MKMPPLGTMLTAPSPSNPTDEVIMKHKKVRDHKLQDWDFKIADIDL